MAPEDYKNWLNEAEWDLETAEILKDKKRYNSSAFYAQQAVEKLLKSALIFKNEEPWGHSTRELLIKSNDSKRIKSIKLFMDINLGGVN